MDCTNRGGSLQLVYGEGSLGVHGAGNGKSFHYIFSYGRGGLESLVTDGMEWIYRTPAPAFWRALTDNDRGNGFHQKSGIWSAADRYIKCLGAAVFVDKEEIAMPVAPENNRYSGGETAGEVSLVYTFETILEKTANVTVEYTVSGDGQILVRVHYKGAEGLPELPVFGLRFLMPTCADGFRYEGLSGETYPDRKQGGIPGVYEVEGMPVTPYLVPQDCGMHVDTRWVEVKRSKVLSNCREPVGSQSLRFSMRDKEFAFSCLPYTSQELENATHQEELPPPRRTVLSIFGAVRGVGGIDSWGSEVEAPYHVDARKDIEYSFLIN
ncbi:MAG: beta-galactosidase small subunit [Eubacteriales bacterium]|nr:beta-galactosidase small subunit [Eubacteriales bacterium]